MITLTLTDSQETNTWNVLTPPVTIKPVDGVQTTQTLDNNVSRYFTYRKRQWVHKWPYMTSSDFNILKGFEDRQFTLKQYPTLSITELGIVNVPVDITIGDRDIIDNCITYNNITLTMRETTN